MLIEKTYRKGRFRAYGWAPCGSIRGCGGSKDCADICQAVGTHMLMETISGLAQSCDIRFLEFLNQFSQKSRFFDRVVCGFEREWFLKGGVITALLWWAWFRTNARQARDRVTVLAGVAAIIPELAVARLLADCLPFRDRPIFTPSLHFVPPFGSESASLIHWSSFPSDHASMFFCLACTLLFVSIRVGALALCYTLVFICMPRLYMGVHYPTDILAGAVIGVAFAVLFQRKEIRDFLGRALNPQLEKSRGMFYLGFYLYMLLIATNFDTPRKAAVLIVDYFKTHAN